MPSNESCDIVPYDKPQRTFDVVPYEKQSTELIPFTEDSLEYIPIDEKEILLKQVSNAYDDVNLILAMIDTYDLYEQFPCNLKDLEFIKDPFQLMYYIKKCNEQYDVLDPNYDNEIKVTPRRVLYDLLKLDPRTREVFDGFLGPEKPVFEPEKEFEFEDNPIFGFKDEDDEDDESIFDFEDNPLFQ